MTTVVVTQPTYLPWLGYFELLAQADHFVFLDCVQFEKQSWQSRNRLRSVDGAEVWLSVPVARHPLETPIRAVEIAPRPADWRRKHLAGIRSHLGRAEHFAHEFPLLEPAFDADHRFLADLTIDVVRRLANRLGLQPCIHRASELDVHGRRAHLLLDICGRLGATRYYSNRGSQAYLDEDRHLFDAAGIEIVYQSWQPPTYRQRGRGFVSHLSMIDALMNVGADAVRSWLEPGPAARDDDRDGGRAAA